MWHQLELLIVHSQVGQAHQWQPLTATQAVNCCWGLAHARHCTPALHDILQANQLPASLAQLKAQQVTTMLWSCATLNHQPVEILTSLASQYRQRPEGEDTLTSSIVLRPGSCAALLCDSFIYLSTHL